MKLKTILHQVIKERNNILTEMFDFDKIEPFKYTSSCGGSSSRGDFELDDGSNVEMRTMEFPFDVGGYREDLPPDFDQENNMIYDLHYLVNGSPSQDKKTNIKEFTKILKTVFDWIKKDAIPCIEKNSGSSRPIFHIASQSKNTSMSNFRFEGDAQKDKIYLYLIKKYMPTGYKMQEGYSNRFNKKVFFIQKK